MAEAAASMVEAEDSMAEEAVARTAADTAKPN
jgi:hypothetical protein